MREIDRLAAEDFNLSIPVLMERAGRAVFRSVMNLTQPPARLAFLCGKGHNGGDALIAARCAFEAGYQVTVLVCAASPDELAPASREALKAYPGEIRFVGDPRFDDEAAVLADYDLIIDGLLGTGQTGAPREPVSSLIERANASGRPILAVDIPSGIDCDTGLAPGAAIHATQTITFGLPKPFLFQGAGIDASGEWDLDDLGLPAELREEPTDALLVGADYLREHLPLRPRNAHKGLSGRVGVVAGSQYMPGAAALACRGAVRAGAGWVQISGPPEVQLLVGAQLPEVLATPDLPTLVDALVIGPGITERRHIFGAIAKRIPCVLDAEALNLLADVPQEAEELPACVLTPHPGEAARLLGISSQEVQDNRFRSARDLAVRLSSCVILKGAHSITAAPYGPLLVCATGNSGMATAGMGDVLAGVVGALLAVHLPPRQAAAVGMIWHGLAGDWCANHIGPIGFLAHEVADALPKVRATMSQR